MAKRFGNDGVVPLPAPAPPAAVASLLTQYRPQRWEDVIGQDAVVKSLSAAVRTHKSPAFLLVGGPGLGKTTLARLAAAELRAGEVIEIDAATHTSIDDMRAITETLPYRMWPGPRCFIVDECHALSKAAWQSLLKALEDPPPHIYWFLCTTEVGKVPVAIKRQRALTYTLRAVPDRQLEKWLEHIAAKSALSPQFIGLCVQAAEGSPRAALAALAVAAEAETAEEVSALIQVGEGPAEAFQLARCLLHGGAWPQVQALLRGLAAAGTEAEAVRRIVTAYCTKVAISSNKEPLAGRAVEVIDAFKEPFYNSVGVSALAHACAVLLLAG